jgi:hypothetical protein
VAAATTPNPAGATTLTAEKKPATTEVQPAKPTNPQVQVIKEAIQKFNSK